MEELRALLKKPDSNSSLLKRIAQEKTQCTSFVAEATTAKVYKVCEFHSQCTDNCVAVKISEQTAEAKIQLKITKLLKGTKAAIHFNKLLGILKGAIVLEYEENAWPFKTLADLIKKGNITERLWKSINFQFIVAIFYAQKAIPGFAHNDTHTENILVVREQHACEVVTPAKQHLKDKSLFTVRIIDFGQVLATAPSLQSPDGKSLHKHVWKNKMVDFMRFAVWAFKDLESLKHKKKWHEDWLRFVLRWLDPHFFTGEFTDSEQGFMANKAGGLWLQKKYGPSSNLGIGNMLDDVYFSDFK